LLQEVLFDLEVLSAHLILEGHLFQEILLLLFLLEVPAVLVVLALPCLLSHQPWVQGDHDLLYYLVFQESLGVL
jgi:hypothetical protein